MWYVIQHKNSTSHKEDEHVFNLDKFVSNWGVVSTNSHQQVIHIFTDYTKYYWCGIRLK